MRRGFTLLEIIIVIIIIGILATLGLTQYGRMVERSRGAEARTILGSLRSQAAAHYLEYNSLIAPVFDATRAGIGAADDQIPAADRLSHYFTYAVATPNATTLTATATRAGAGGKGGATPAAGRTLILTTTFPAGTDTWTGTGGY